jgi:hypothetical protein
LVEDAAKILKKHNADFGLPANISEEFIDRILKNKVCICGRPFESGSKAEKSIIEYKRQALTKQLSATLCGLFSTVNPDTESYLLKNNSAIIARIRNAVDDIAELDQQISDNEEKKRDLQSQCDSTAQAEFERLKVQHDEAKNRLFYAGREQADAENEKVRIAEKLEEKIRERKKITTGDESKKLIRAIDIAQELLDDIERCRINFRRVYHKFLQEHTAYVYNEIVTDGSEAVVNKETFLPSIYRAGVKVLNNGGGQEQTLVLAFISALSALRRRVNSDLRKLFFVKNLDEQCFFMDSVFANMDDTYRIRAAKALSGSMKQLVLLLSPQQWSGPIA